MGGAYRIFRRFIPTGFLLALLTGLLPGQASALPIYARQTGNSCDACHVAFPELTPFGRRFKLSGYTWGGNRNDIPVAVMLQPTFTHTNDDQPGGAAPRFGKNDNIAAVQQASIFTGGRIAENFGFFNQNTYDSGAGRIGLDITDLRYANTSELFGHDLIYGVTVNDSPTAQDVWNSTPIWSFPYIIPELSPGHAAAVELEGGEASKVVGTGIYGFWDDRFYVELTGYRTLATRALTFVGVDSTQHDAFDGTAPYWRAAYEENWGENSLEVGTFGLHASIKPQHIDNVGTDGLTDVGVDAQYQWITDPHEISLKGYWINEDRTLSASQPLGLASNATDTLRSWKVSASYVYDRTWSITEHYFALTGSADASLYGTQTGSPNTNGWITELAYLPFMHGGPAFWEQLNARIALQYIAYDKFDGSSSNIDGNGRPASGNDTWFLSAWIMF